MADAKDKEITKTFTTKEIANILSALNNQKKSYDRRITAAEDIEEQAIWEKKEGDINLLITKIRLT